MYEEELYDVKKKKITIIIEEDEIKSFTTKLLESSCYFKDIVLFSTMLI